ncbi:hypothetical protein Moror_5492, partial [Moniliophthora roreri MCA 2997]
SLFLLFVQKSQPNQTFLHTLSRHELGEASSDFNFALLFALFFPFFWLSTPASITDINEPVQTAATTTVERQTRSKKVFSPFVLEDPVVLDTTINLQRLFDDAVERQEEGVEGVDPEDIVEQLGGASLVKARDPGSVSRTSEKEVIDGIVPLAELTMPLDEETRARNPDPYCKERKEIPLHSSVTPRNDTAVHSPGIQPGQRTDRTEAQQKRQDRSHKGYRLKRKAKREGRQEARGTVLKGCALKRAAETVGSKGAVETDHKLERCGYVGPRVAASQSLVTLPVYLGMPGMRVVPCKDIHKGRIIRGHDGTTYGFIAGQPHSFEATLVEFQQIMEWAEERIRFGDRNRRGPHYKMIGMGPSMGGGQKQPMCLRAGDNGKNGEVLDEVRNNWAVNNVAWLHDHCLGAIWPKIHALYTRIIQLIFEKTGERPNFKNCCFAGSYFNFRNAFSLEHYDHLNFYCGLCVVFNAGKFDASKGGHIILWELGGRTDEPDALTSSGEVTFGIRRLGAYSIGGQQHSSDVDALVTEDDHTGSGWRYDLEECTAVVNEMGSSSCKEQAKLADLLLVCTGRGDAFWRAIEDKVQQRKVFALEHGEVYEESEYVAWL